MLESEQSHRAGTWMLPVTESTWVPPAPAPVLALQILEEAIYNLATTALQQMRRKMPAPIPGRLSRVRECMIISQFSVNLPLEASLLFSTSSITGMWALV